MAKESASERIQTKVIHMSVSPKAWGLSPPADADPPNLRALGLPRPELELRARRNTYEWLTHQFNEEAGAFYGYYDPRSKTFAEPQNANLIAPFQLIAAFDRYQDERLLDMACRCADWLEHELAETHPMSLVLGGVRDNLKPNQLWTKYTADYVVQCLALWDRTREDRFLRRAIASSKFLLQSQNHGFSPKFDHGPERWTERGWDSWGRAVLAMMALQEFTGDHDWLDRAVAWAEHGLSVQSADGCFYLIDQTYYSSDIAADELRALIRAYWKVDREKFLRAALKFADWHVRNQWPNGAWPLSVDRWGVTVTEYIGPGDIPNIAIAMLMAHAAAQQIRHLVSAVKALRYSITQQSLPDGSGPYADDPHTHWGFWSWDPHYDYTMSMDQSTHHVRGYWFFIDYFCSLPESMQKAVIDEAGPPDPNLSRVSEKLLAAKK